MFYTLALPDQAGAAFSWMFETVTTGFDWFFLTAANIFVIFCLMLIVTPLGSVRLGGKEASPDYTYLGWFAMLFAAGMGIGLMFYGVSEPMTHFSTALGGTSMENGVRTDWAPLGGAEGDAADALRVSAWRRRSFTGVCTLGRSMRSSRWRSRFSATTRGCR